jgi:hypothetical protein
VPKVEIVPIVKIEAAKEPEVVQDVAPVVEIENVKEPEIVQDVAPIVELESMKEPEVIPEVIQQKIEAVKEPEVAQEIVQIDEFEIPKEDAQPNSNIIDLGKYICIFHFKHPLSDQLAPAVVEEPNSSMEIVEGTPRATEFGQLLSFDSSNEETPEIVPPSAFVHNRSSSDEHDSTRTRTITPQPVFSDDEHDSGVGKQL